MPYRKNEKEKSERSRLETKLNKNQQQLVKTQYVFQMGLGTKQEVGSS